MNNITKELKNNNSYFNRNWRPAMAWSYLIICLFDFLIAPIGHAVVLANFFPTIPFVSWKPITLEGGGLYHLAMLTIVGVTSYSRGQEKMKIIDAITSSALKQPINEPIISEPEKTS